MGAAIGQTTNEAVKFSFGKTNEGWGGGIVNEKFDNKPATTDASRVFDFYTVTLLEVLERLNAPTDIDYFSLDVEGK